MDWTAAALGRKDRRPMNRNWVGKAACSGLDPAVFYPPTDEDADEAKAAEIEAAEKLAAE